MFYGSQHIFFSLPWSGLILGVFCLLAYYFISLYGCLVLIAVHELSIVAASEGYTLAVVCRLVIAVASLVQHGL